MTRAMKVSARDIDHLAITTTTPEEMVGRLQRLGFAFTPEGVEPRCICFQPDRDDIPNFIALFEGEPQVALALNVAELEGEERRHAWESEDNLPVEADLIVGQGSGPPPWFPVAHKAPAAFMEPEWIVHPNGALGLVAVHVVSDDPPALGKTLKEGWQAESEEMFDGCVLVKTGAVELLVWSAAAWQLEYRAIEAMAPQPLPQVVGVAIAVERSSPLQALLRANNVNFALGDDGRVIVPPEQAGGMMVEFMPQT
jgi:hypothetical protein